MRESAPSMTDVKIEARHKDWAARALDKTMHSNPSWEALTAAHVGPDRLWHANHVAQTFASFEASLAKQEAEHLPSGWRDETGWLIEKQIDNGPTSWLETLAAPGYDGWTTSAIDALRFARRRDADTFCEYYVGEPAADSGIHIRITEHRWSAPTTGGAK